METLVEGVIAEYAKVILEQIEAEEFDSVFYNIQMMKEFEERWDT